MKLVSVMLLASLCAVAQIVSQPSGGGGGGIVLSGTGNPSGATCTAVLVGTVTYLDTSISPVAAWDCVSTGVWMKRLETSNTGPLSLISPKGSIGATCTSGAGTPAGSACIHYDSGDASLHYYDGDSASDYRTIAPLAVVAQTAQTGAIPTTTLCASTPGACAVAGGYQISWTFYGSGTACGTPGPGGVTLALTWTDPNATIHAAVVPLMLVQTGATTTALQSTFAFQAALANESAGGSMIVQTNGAVIQYATTYTACTVGTGTYNLIASAMRVQ